MFSTISPSNPLDMDSSTGSAPSTPVTAPTPSTDPTASSVSFEERLRRMRPALDSRLIETLPWDKSKAIAAQQAAAAAANAAAAAAPPPPPAASATPSHLRQPTSSSHLNAASPMLRIGFETHGASRSPSTNTSSPNSNQHPLANQPKPSQLSVQPSQQRRGSVDESSTLPSTSSHTSIINGVSLSSAIPSTRSQSPLPTSSAPTSTPLLSVCLF